MTEQILYGRGITNIDAWLKANMHDVESWSIFDDIEKAVYKLTSAIKDNWDTCIIDSMVGQLYHCSSR